jgi:hypothetical protein
MIKNLRNTIDLKNLNLLNKESLLYIINNEISAGSIEIKLASSVYNRLSTDAEIISAIEAHSNISLVA